MAKRTFLLFRYSDTQYALEVPEGTEILELPELSSPANTLSPLAGFANVHGQVIPVIDINQFLGDSSPRQHALSEQMVVIDYGPDSFAVIIPEVIDVMQLDTPEANIQTIQGDIGIIFVITHESLLDKIKNADNNTGPFQSFIVDPKDIPIFHMRAILLMKPEEQVMQQETAAYLVVRVGDVFFGIEAEKALEVSGSGYITPIPKVPPQVLGLMNLRGSSLLVLDLAVLMELDRIGKTSHPYVIVTSYQDTKLGLLVGEAVDILTLNTDEHQEPPKNLGWVKSIANYQGNILAIIDIDMLLHSSRPEQIKLAVEMA